MKKNTVFYDEFATMDATEHKLARLYPTMYTYGRKSVLYRTALNNGHITKAEYDKARYMYRSVWGV